MTAEIIDLADYRKPRTEDRETFSLLLQAYRSGQVTPAQFVEHLLDPAFAEWFKLNG